MRLRLSSLFFLLCLPLLLAACATNPVTGQKELTLVSEREEVDIGTKNYQPGQQASGGRLVTEPDVAAYITEVGRRLVKVSDRPNLPYEFVVLNDSTPNAWAMPGGKLAINRGLLYELKSESELAAVMGHEIVHAAARHGARSIETGLVLQVGAAVVGAAMADKQYGELAGAAAGLGAGLLGLKYGRDHELEADHYGMIYMARAGYDPAAAIALQETFVRLAKDRQPNWLEGLFASHPPSQERVEANRKLAATLPVAAGTRADDEARYRQRLAPLMKTRAAYDAYDEGRKALAKGDAAAARSLAERAIAAEPREALFYGLRGDARVKAGDPAGAEVDYGEAIRRNADYYAFYQQRGLARLKLQNLAAARADFERSIALLPTVPAHHALGVMAQNEGRVDLAMRHYRAAAAGGEPGRPALTALARLELPRAPANWFATSKSYDSAGRLIIAITNRAPLMARNITVQLQVMRNALVVDRQETFVFDGLLRPGATGRMAVALKSPAGAARVDLNRITVNVAAAQPVD